MFLTVLLLLGAPHANPDCYKAGGDLEIAQCWGRAFETADERLNKIWPKIVKQARNSDQTMLIDKPEKHISLLQDLKRAQRAWLIYRDAECQLKSGYAKGGRLEGIISSQCKTQMTEDRIKDLQNQAAGWLDG